MGLRPRSVTVYQVGILFSSKGAIFHGLSVSLLPNFNKLSNSSQSVFHKVWKPKIAIIWPKNKSLTLTFGPYKRRSRLCRARSRILRERAYHLETNHIVANFRLCANPPRIFPDEPAHLPKVAKGFCGQHSLPVLRCRHGSPDPPILSGGH